MQSHDASYPELAGTTAVVTGAARGIGEAHTLALVRQGVNVVAGDINLEHVSETATRINTEYGGRASVIPVRIDVSSREDHAAVADRALQEFGQLDHWINNAGVFPQGPVRQITAREFDATAGININGVLFGAQAAAEAMDGRGGSIVNMASIAAFTVRKGSAAYAVTKAAVDHLTRVLAVELGPEGIRVNAIAPGIIDTQMTAWVRESKGVQDAVLDSIPLRRMGLLADVASAMLFLVSDSSGFVAGHTLVVDGGGRYR